MMTKHKLNSNWLGFRILLLIYTNSRFVLPLNLYSILFLIWTSGLARKFYFLLRQSPDYYLSVIYISPRMLLIHPIHLRRCWTFKTEATLSNSNADQISKLFTSDRLISLPWQVLNSDGVSTDWFFVDRLSYYTHLWEASCLLTFTK
jgi:hypothetical protein